MPERFADLAHAREVFRGIFDWYNNQHHHSGIVYLHALGGSITAAPTRSSIGAIAPAWPRTSRTRTASSTAPRSARASRRRFWINPPEKSDAPGWLRIDDHRPDDPEVVPVSRTYGTFEKLAVMPRELATAPRGLTKCQQRLSHNR